MTILNHEKKTLKHFKIYEALASGIKSGQYNPGQRIPTIENLAKRFEVSMPTIGRALNRLEQDGLITRKQGSGVFIDTQAQRTSLKKNGIGFLIPNLTDRNRRDNIFSDLVTQIIMETQQHNFAVSANSYSVQPDTFVESLKKACSELIAQHVEGLIFLCMETGDSEERDAEIARILNSLQIPIVLLDRDIFQYPKRSLFDVVGLDNQRASYVLTTHLIRLGNRHIRFFATSFGTDSPAVILRIAGYQNALLAHHLELYPVLLAPYGHDAEIVRIIKELLDENKPDAFVCLNDETAIQVMKIVNELGYRVPHDIRIVGFDDIAISGMLPVPLTTIKQPVRLIASEAVRAITETIRTHSHCGRDILLNGELIIRESCGAHLEQVV